MASTVSSSTFHAGRDNNFSVTQTHNYYEKNPLTSLRQHAALGALHNAAERPDPPKCHPETRTAILDRIDQWMRDRSDNARPVLWLSGAAGAGKSAIAQTLIERWLEEGIVCPNFFFWRTSPMRNIKTYFVFTLAFQLGNMLPVTRSEIGIAVQDGAIFGQNLRTQMQRLIVEPLLAIEAARGEKHLTVLVVDGLDECCVDLARSEGFPGQNYEEQQKEILDTVTFACQKVSSLRVLVASRPERQMRISFSSSPLHLLTLPLSLNNEADADADITLYLDCKFAEIRSQNDGIDPSWPSTDQISQLVKNASGQFIYPSTAVKYIARRRQHPVRSLEEVLSAGSTPASVSSRSHPLAELDALYALIIGSVATESWPTVKVILGLMFWTNGLGSISTSGLHVQVHLERPQIFRDLVTELDISVEFSLPYLERFLLLTNGELATHLVDLHSVIDIYKGSMPLLRCIRSFHATLGEYLTSESRSGKFFISDDFTHIQCALLLVAHAKRDGTFGKTSEHVPWVYDRSKILHFLRIYVTASPPNNDLIGALWDLLKEWIGEYAQISNFDSGSLNVDALYENFASISYNKEGFSEEFRGLVNYLIVRYSSLHIC